MFLMICAIKFKVKLKRKILFKTFIARASHFLFLINVSYFLNSFKLISEMMNNYDYNVTQLKMAEPISDP